MIECAHFCGRCAACSKTLVSQSAKSAAAAPSGTIWRSLWKFWNMSDSDSTTTASMIVTAAAVNAKIRPLASSVDASV